MSNRIPFQKPYTSAHDLVCLLQSRGLTVTDTAKAESYLEYIGYYRLSAYMYPLLQMPKEQLYVALNYWATATFKDHNAITLNDKEAGCIIISSTISNIVEHTGTLNKYSVSITPVIRLDIKEGRVRVTYTVQNYDILRDISGGWLSPVDKDDKTFGDSKRKKGDMTNASLYDEQWEIARHYPFVQTDAQKRTCAKALVMTHAYSNAVLDKVEEAVKNGVVGNEDEDW